MRVICILIQSGKSIPEIAECCYRWTPQIAIREGEAVFLEVESCQKLYKEETLLLKIQALLKRFGVKGRLAIANDAALSLCLARLAPVVNEQKFSQEKLQDFPPGELPIEAFYDIASPFKKDEEQFKQIQQLIAVLKTLGIRNIGEFLKLPSRTLSSRFHELGLELHKRSLFENSGIKPARHQYEWPSFVPPEKIEEKINLDEYENCQILEPLLFLTKNLVSRAMARLAGRCERVARFELELDLEKHSTVKKARRTWNFILPLPQGSTTGLLPLIQERLQTDLQNSPLESGVTSMKFSILETVPGQYGQKNFFNKKEEEQEAWNSLMARLCQKLGKEHTFVAASVESYRPEKAWRKTWSETAAVSLDMDLNGIELPFPQRPLRILKSPIPLFKVQNTLITENAAVSLAGHHNRWEIRDWEGPERLQGEWWSEGSTGFRRDYFRVSAANGEQLWIYRIPESDRLFLHGYFD